MNRTYISIEKNKCFSLNFRSFTYRDVPRTIYYCHSSMFDSEITLDLLLLVALQFKYKLISIRKSMNEMHKCLNVCCFYA